MKKLKELNYYVPFKAWMFVGLLLSFIGAGLVQSFVFVPLFLVIIATVWVCLGLIFD